MQNGPPEEGLHQRQGDLELHWISLVTPVQFDPSHTAHRVLYGRHDWSVLHLFVVAGALGVPATHVPFCEDMLGL